MANREWRIVTDAIFATRHSSASAPPATIPLLVVLRSQQSQTRLPKWDANVRIGPPALILAGRAVLAQRTISNGVLPIAQRRLSTPPVDNTGRHSRACPGHPRLALSKV